MFGVGNYTAPHFFPCFVWLSKSLVTPNFQTSYKIESSFRNQEVFFFSDNLGEKSSEMTSQGFPCRRQVKGVLFSITKLCYGVHHTVLTAGAFVFIFPRGAVGFAITLPPVRNARVHTGELPRFTLHTRTVLLVGEIQAVRF